MRRKALVLFSVLAVLAMASTAAGAPSNPQIRAKQAHAREVLAKIDQIGTNLEQTVQAWDGAKLQLAKVQLQLQRNTYALHVARRNLHVAQGRIMHRLYSLYVQGQPTAMDVLAGAQSLSQIIDRLESAQVLSNQDASIGKQAVSFQLNVQQRERLLQSERQKRATVVQDLASRRNTIEAALAQQKQLYASDRSAIRRLQAAEVQHQRELQAAAQARVAAAIAQARQQAQEQAQSQQESSDAAASSSGAASSGGSSGSTGATDPPPVSVPSGSGAGHPEAAQIALGYLGVPYVWGGASPSGFDCSGLVMYVYAQLGISLPHYTVAQWDATEPISPSEMQPGDLVFFDGLGHVGIYIGNGEFVDAPHTGSVVRIDSLANFGGFVGARRVP